MARKSRKNVQATPAVVVGPVQYKVALYARISVENEQKREADTKGTVSYTPLRANQTAASIV